MIQGVSLLHLVAEIRYFHDGQDRGPLADAVETNLAASHGRTDAPRARQEATPRRVTVRAVTAYARDGRWNSPAPRKARIASRLRSSPIGMACSAVTGQALHLPSHRRSGRAMPRHKRALPWKTETLWMWLQVP